MCWHFSYSNMSSKVELLYHHGDLVGYIHHLMKRPDLNSNLGQKYEKGDSLTLERATEEYLKMVDKDAFYHTNDSQVRESYKTGIKNAVLAAEGGVIYVSDYTLKDDPICQGCYWYDREDADPRRCVRAASKRINSR